MMFASDSGVSVPLGPFQACGGSKVSVIDLIRGAVARRFLCF